MKNYCSFCFIIFSYFYSQKVYTIPKTKLSTAEGAAYYSTYENDKEALLEALILLMEQNAITINFQISKNILNGKSESWYKMEIKKKLFY
jgi:hypothetical protein